MLFTKRISIVLLAIVWVAQACTLRLIAPYDEITDRKITELQTDVATFFVELERQIGTPKADYENHIAFYNRTRVGLSTLDVRAKAIEKNDIVIQQIELLDGMVNDLEALHRIGFKNPGELSPIKSAFNSAFTAMVKLQMGLKRGEK